MKRHLWMVAISLIVAICMSFCLAACDSCNKDDNKSHTHKYTWTPNEDGTTHNGVCNAEGECDAKNITNEAHDYGSDNKCTKCGAEKPETPVHVHNYAWTDNKDGTHNGVCNGTVGECDAKNITNEAHSYDKDTGKCVCGATKPDDNPGHNHNYTWTDNEDGTHDGHCDVAGCDKPDVTNEDHIWGENDKCERCDADKPDDPNPGHTHNYTNWTVDPDDATKHIGTCDAEGECNAPTKSESHTYGDDDTCKCGATKPETPPAPETMTHAEFVAAAKGDEVKVAGIVTAFRNKNVFLMDEDGGYYAFGATTVPANLAVGMAVTVTGTKDVYSGLDEITGGVIEITNATPATVTPVDITTALSGATAASDADLLAMQNTYVVLTGVITSNSNGATIKVGEKEYTFYVGGSSQVVTTAQQTTIKEAFADANGKTADVTAIVAIRNGAIQLVPANATPVSVHREPAKALGAPAINLDEDTGVVSWAKVNNAVAYKYVITTEGVEADPETTTNRSVTISDGQSIKVMAVGDGENYKDDDNPYSNVITYNKTPLEAPVVSKSDSGAGAKWAEVENAVGYYYEITPETGDKRTGTTTNTSIRLDDKDSIVVKAVASGEDKYKDSPFSTAYVHEAPADPTPLDAPTVSISRTGLATFSSDGAVSYEYKLNDGAAVALPEGTNTLQLNDNDKIEVRAIGTSEAENSGFSTAKTYKAPVPYSDPDGFNFAADTETEGNVVITWNAPSNTVEGVTPRYKVAYVETEGGEENTETVTACSVSIELKAYYSVTVTVLAGTNTTNVPNGDYSTTRRDASNAVNITADLTTWFNDRKVAAEKAALANFLPPQVVVEKNLPIRVVGATYSDVKITWSFVEPDADIDDYADFDLPEKVLSIHPANANGTKNITVKATLTCGTSTDFVTFPIEIKQLQTTDETFTFADLGYTNAQLITEVNGITAKIVFAKADGGTAPTCYTDEDTAIPRVYTSNTITITADDLSITQIEFTLKNNATLSATVTPADGTYKNNVWSGTATSVTFTVSSGSNKANITAIKVTYEMPNYTDAQKVEKAFAALPKNIAYDIAGFDVDVEGKLGTTINWTVTLEDGTTPSTAVAIDDDGHATVTRGEADVIVKIHAQVTLNGETSELKTYGPFTVDKTGTVVKTWTKVTDISQLEDGTQVIITTSTDAFAMGGVASGKSFASNVAITAKDGKITTLPDDVVKLTIKTGTSGKFALTTVTGEGDDAVTNYFKATAAKSVSYSTTEYYWTISIAADGVATISAATTSHGDLKYNSSSPRFTTYTSGQVSLSIYALI